MKTISLQNIQSEIKGTGEFCTAGMEFRYEYNKRSYTHRLMCITNGSCSFHYGKRHFRCEKGDIIYFPPNQLYGNDFYGQDFRVINIFFDFYPYRGDSYVLSTTCVEGSSFPEYMGETVHFSDCEFFNTLRRIINFPDGAEQIAAINKEYSERRICYKQKASAMLTDLLISLYRFSESGAKEKSMSEISEILSYIDENCRLPLRGEMLSEKFNYHPNYINRLIQRATSMSLHTYILDTKIRHAAVMLRDTDMSITDIAMYFSFYDSSYFSNVFRKFIGCTPHEYRNNNRVGEQGEIYL